MDTHFSDEDLQELREAKDLLENPGITAKITNLIGSPIEKGLVLLPQHWSAGLAKITETALTSAAKAAVFTLKDKPGAEASNRWHKLGAALSGGVGGFLGLPALAIELPVSTSIMMRSIADIARSEGESLADNETKLACIEVFALGGKSKADDGSDSGYYAVRAVLAKSIADTSEFMVGRTLTEEGAPIFIKLIAKVAERFGIQVTEKAAAQAIPAIGAAAGALINTMFMDHFQDMARGHFKIRKLERKYGKEITQARYLDL